MRKNLFLCGTVLALAMGSHSAIAGNDGRWELKFGAHTVNPKSDNGTLRAGTTAFNVDVGNDVRPTFNVGYWLTDNWQLDVLAALPFEHDVELNGGRAASFKHLPPTVTLQYHFNPEGGFDPFVGIGLNYTFVYDEEEVGPLAGTRLGLDNSFGLAAQIGAAVALNDNWSIAGDVRWFDIDSDAELNGASLGTVNVDPIAVGLFAIYRF
jgi:outer membrane protein